MCVWGSWLMFVLWAWIRRIPSVRSRVGQWTSRLNRSQVHRMPDGAETITDADLSRLQNPKFHFEKNLRFQSSKNNMDLNYQILDFDAGGYAQMCVWDWLLIGLFDPSQSIANRWTSAPRYKRDVTPVEAQNKASNHGPHTDICADPPDCKS